MTALIYILRKKIEIAYYILRPSQRCWPWDREYNQLSITNPEGFRPYFSRSLVWHFELSSLQKLLLFLSNGNEFFTFYVNISIVTILHSILSDLCFHLISWETYWESENATIPATRLKDLCKKLCRFLFGAYANVFQYMTKAIKIRRGYNKGYLIYPYNFNLKFVSISKNSGSSVFTTWRSSFLHLWLLYRLQIRTVVCSLWRGHSSKTTQHIIGYDMWYRTCGKNCNLDRTQNWSFGA